MDYMLVVYDYNINATLCEPMKNRIGPDIVEAYKIILTLTKTCGLKPSLQQLDNEASAMLCEFITSNSIDFQLAPPNIHCRNAVERAIRTLKNNFVAVLCGTDPKFPMQLWDHILEQVQVTLNFLCASRINPRLSAHAQLHGGFDFNRTPIGPLGTIITAQNTPGKRESWAPHGSNTWYLGPASFHYRCYRAFIIETRSERIPETIKWFPAHVPMPKTASVDAATAALTDLITAILNPAPASPLAGI